MLFAERGEKEKDRFALLCSRERKREGGVARSLECNAGTVDAQKEVKGGSPTSLSRKKEERE